MNDAARLAAVILRLVAAGMMVYALIALVLQLGMLAVSPNLQHPPIGTMIVQTALGTILFLMPGVWLYRNSRELGIRLTRGLE